MEKILTIDYEKLIKTVEAPTIFDIIIIGGGVAGLTSGLYSARDGFKVLILEGVIESSLDAPGGALLLTNEIANFPSFGNKTGTEFIESLRTQTLESGATIYGERAKNIIFSTIRGNCHTVFTTENTYQGRVIILAMGALPKRLEVPGEDEMYGRGVSSCATCDGFFFKEKKVAIIGGGDTAAEDALLLSRLASKVVMLVRSDRLKASSPEATIIANHPDIEIVWNSSVEKILSSEDKTTVVGIQTSNKNVPTHTTTIKVDGVFVAIGSYPATSLLEDSGIKLDNEGYILVHEPSTRVQGDVVGVFAAGDVVDKIYRQAVTSAGKAAQASIEARSYMETH